eukprot:5816243-Amphidinium_carterae.5
MDPLRSNQARGANAHIGVSERQAQVCKKSGQRSVKAKEQSIRTVNPAPTEFSKVMPKGAWSVSSKLRRSAMTTGRTWKNDVLSWNWKA